MFFRLIGRQTSSTNPPILRKFVVAVLSGLVKKVTRGAYNPSLSHWCTATWSEDRASFSHSRHARMHARSSCCCTVCAIPTKAVHNCRNESNVAT